MKPKRKGSHVAAMLDGITLEEVKRRGDAADALYREIVRKVRGDD